MSPHAPVVACIGECMLELRQTGHRQLALGYAGDTYNTAYYLTASHEAADVQYVTVVGEDVHSTEMLDEFAAHGVGTRWIDRHPSRIPGLYLIDLDQHGERTFTYYRSESAARTLFDERFTARHAAQIARADMLYLSGVTLSILTDDARERLLDTLRTAREAGATVVFDSNYRPRAWTAPEKAVAASTAIYGLTDIALPSFTDEQVLFGDSSPEECLRRIAGYGVAEIVVKNGAEPGHWAACDGRSGTLEPVRVPRAIDTTGAGDSFNGGYLATRLSGDDPAEACRKAARLAAHVTQQRGAIVDLGSAVLGS